jgi:hypothetical protein
MYSNRWCGRKFLIRVITYGTVIKRCIYNGQRLAWYLPLSWFRQLQTIIMEHGNMCKCFPFWLYICICYNMPCDGTMGIFDKNVLIGFMKDCQIIHSMWFYVNYVTRCHQFKFFRPHGRLMVSVLASCVVNRGLEPRSGQTKDYIKWVFVASMLSTQH